MQYQPTTARQVQVSRGSRTSTVMQRGDAWGLAVIVLGAVLFAGLRVVHTLGMDVHEFLNIAWDVFGLPVAITAPLLAAGLLAGMFGHRSARASTNQACKNACADSRAAASGLVIDTPLGRTLAGDLAQGPAPLPPSVTPAIPAAMAGINLTAKIFPSPVTAAQCGGLLGFLGLPVGKQ